MGDSDNTAESFLGFTGASPRICTLELHLTYCRRFVRFSAEKKKKIKSSYIGHYFFCLQMKERAIDHTPSKAAQHKYENILF